MSSSDRKIAFYNFEYKKHGEDNTNFNKTHFLGFMSSIQSLQHIMDIPRSHKAISIERITQEQVNFKDVVKVIFKSCKYNHSPEYMSKIDGAVRDSDKQLHEGEKELTHMCMVVNSNHADVIVEERRSGTTINEIIKFLNQCLRLYNGNHGITNNFRLEFSLVPSEDFIRSLEGMNRVRIAEVYKHKRILGSETMNMLEREDHSMKEEVVITLKAKAGESLMKHNLKRLYRQAIGHDEEITRIRVVGNDEQSNSIRLDSDFMKKLEYVKAELNENGTVNSNNVLEKMLDLLGLDLSEEEVV